MTSCFFASTLLNGRALPYVMRIDSPNLQGRFAPPLFSKYVLGGSLTDGTCMEHVHGEGLSLVTARASG